MLKRSISGAEMLIAQNVPVQQWQPARPRVCLCMGPCKLKASCLPLNPHKDPGPSSTRIIFKRSPRSNPVQLRPHTVIAGQGVRLEQLLSTSSFHVVTSPNKISPLLFCRFRLWGGKGELSTPQCLTMQRGRPRVCLSKRWADFKAQKTHYLYQLIKFEQWPPSQTQMFLPKLENLWQFK